MAVAALLAGIIGLLVYDALAARRRKEKSTDGRTKIKARAKTKGGENAHTRPAAAEPVAEPARAETNGSGQSVANPSKATIIDDDLDNVEIDDEALAQAVLNWTPPRLTDFRSWRDDKPSSDR